MEAGGRLKGGWGGCHRPETPSGNANIRENRVFQKVFSWGVKLEAMLKKCQQLLKTNSGSMIGAWCDVKTNDNHYLLSLVAKIGAWSEVKHF